MSVEKTMDKIVALCKNRGFIFPGSDIYGGLANSWDYGPLGVEFKNNVKKGNLIAEDIENCSIYNDDNSTVIAVVGVKDLNIINSNNVILIANKDKMGELPNLIEKIKCDKEFKKYL